MKYQLSILIILLVLNIKAQEKLRGVNWSVGFAPTLLIQFDSSQIVSLDTLNNLGLTFGSSCISDTNGTLKIICNGHYILGKDGNWIENGDSINTPLGFKLFNYYKGDGFFNQMSIILPKKDNQYYVFTTGMSDAAYDDWKGTQTDFRFDVLSYHIVDMDANAGAGKVVSKNNILMKDARLSHNRMTAVRHANGRDWWLIKPHQTKQIFYTFRVTSDSIFGPFEQKSNFNMDTMFMQAGVEQNRVSTTRFGWLFRHLVTNGSFGDVGEQGVYDANNKFHNIAGTPNLKVRRVFSQTWQCNTSFSPIIYTNSTNLGLGESSSNMANGSDCRYEVENANPGVPYVCNPEINITPSNTSDEVTDIDHALMVAEDSVAYSEFQDMGEVMDERILYAQLVQDTTTRNSYPVLNQFYLDRQQSTMAKLVTIDQLLRKLTDTTVVQNPLEFTSVLNEVKQLNATIASAELYDLNERTINGIFIKEMEYGVDSISQEENEWISTLAWECPYVAGNAVFKARMLYMRINPWAHFNDLSICNAVGVYKNGTGLFDDENAELENTTGQHGVQLIYALVKNSIKLYPNPATDQVNVSYNINPHDKSVLELLDMQGRHIQTIQLPSYNNKVSFSIVEWSNAVYTYRFVVNGAIKENGKLIKE